jgi:hypothetical protein
MKVCHVQSLMIATFSLWVSAAFAYMVFMQTDLRTNHGIDPIYLYIGWGLFTVAVSSWGYLLFNCFRKNGG